LADDGYEESAVVMNQTMKRSRQTTVS